MKYKLTPLNICCVFLVGTEIIFFIFPWIWQNEHYGYQHFYLIPVIFVGLIIDYIIQKILKKYILVLLIELILIATSILLNVAF